MISLLIALSLTAAPDRVVAGTGLRLRAAPDAHAAVVDRAPLGTVLTCTEESKPVTVGAATAPFCKTTTKTGAAWYFTALTEPVAADKNAQRAKIAAKAVEALGDAAGYDKERWPDVYEVHAVLKSLPGLAAKIEETRFVARFANAFTGDPRVYRDEAQGPRLQNDALEKLVDEAKGKPEHEAAAWALYQHGWPFECEGMTDCVLARLHGTACKYLEQFPSGEHAKLAVDDVIATARGQREFLGKFPLDKNDKERRESAGMELDKVGKCVAKAKSGDVKKANAALAELAQVLR